MVVLIFNEKAPAADVGCSWQKKVGIIETARRRHTYRHLTKPNQTLLRPMASEVF
jgi:hypothetical protein